MNDETLSIDEHGGLRYLLRVPTSAANERAPVLVFLHGYDEGAPMPIERALTSHGPLRQGNPADALASFIIVAPQLPTRGDIWFEHARAVESLVRQIQQDNGGHPARTYLSGFSFGGNGVLDLALLQPNVWAALWVVDPTRVPSAAPQRPLWFSFGEIARHRKQQFIRALNLSEEANADHVYIDDGGDHVGAATNAFRDPQIYAWLLRKRL